MRRSITTRLIVLLTLAAALILGGGMLIDYRLSRQEILKRLADEATTEVRVVVGDMENWLNGIEATTRLLGRVLEQREYSQQGLKQMLRDVVANNDEIFGAAIAINPQLTEEEKGFAPYFYIDEGAIRFSDLTKADYAQQHWYTQPIAAGRALWVEPYFDSGGGEINMTTFSVPVFRLDEAGNRFLYAVVTADVSLAALHQVLQQLHLGESSYGLLFSREGLMMSTRTQRRIMKHYSEMDYRGVDLDSWRNMFSKALTGETSTHDFPCPDTGGRCTIRLGRLDTTGWPIGVVYDQQEVLGPLHAYQIKTAAVSGITLSLMALAVYLVTSRLTRPLQELSRATEQVARGQMDVPLPVAHGEDEVARLVRSFSSMSRELKSYIADLETATANRSRLEGELGAAREIQMSMLPGGGQALLQEVSIELWARVQPAKTVGGDLYTYYRDGDNLFIAVGDVSDKGVPAALFMARAISLIQQLAGTSSPPAQAMHELNNGLERDNYNCMFVTLFLGVLDIPSGTLRFSSAGHTPPSLLRARGVTVVDQETGPALGLAADQSYPVNQLQLCPGDRLAIFTDGIDEAFNNEGEMFGAERFNLKLQGWVDQDISEAGHALFGAVETFAGSRPQSDDITLLLLQYNNGTSISAEREFDLSEGLTSRVQAWMEPVLLRRQLSFDTTFELNLVAEEIVTNVQKYSGLAAEEQLTVRLGLEGRTLTLEVCDGGIAFDPLRQSQRSAHGADIESAAIGGLGVHLIIELTDRQSYRREGEQNILRIEKDLPGTTG
jgi:phosphoserine phosphatase RsbU/P